MLLYIYFDSGSVETVFKVVSCAIAFCLRSAMMSVCFPCPCGPVSAPCDGIVLRGIHISVFHDRLRRLCIACDRNLQFCATAYRSVYRGGRCDRDCSVLGTNCHKTIFIYRCKTRVGRTPCHSLIKYFFWQNLCLHLHLTSRFCSRCNSRYRRYVDPLWLCSCIIQYDKCIEFYFHSGTFRHLFIQYLQYDCMSSIL